MHHFSCFSVTPTKYMAAHPEEGIWAQCIQRR